MSTPDHNQDVHLHFDILTDHRSINNDSSLRLQANIRLRSPNLPHPQLPGPSTQAVQLTAAPPHLSLEIVFTSSLSQIIATLRQVLGGITPTHLYISLLPLYLRSRPTLISYIRVRHPSTVDDAHILANDGIRCAEMLQTQEQWDQNKSLPLNWYQGRVS